MIRRLFLLFCFKLRALESSSSDIQVQKNNQLRYISKKMARNIRLVSCQISYVYTVTGQKKCLHDIQCGLVIVVRKQVHR